MSGPTGGDPRIEPPTDDVAPVGEESVLPGVHRGGFHRPPTAPVDLAVTATGPAAEPEPLVMWAPKEEPAPRVFLAGWALFFSIVGLAVSLFVGWGFPLGLVGIVTAIVALLRPLESRRMAVWAIALGVLSLVYSAGWLWFAAIRAELFT
jgi:hypothetical protein